VSIHTSPTWASSYSFDNDDVQAVDRHNYLADMLDQGTIARMSGLGDMSGWRCLEVGAGGGSIARWLAHQVGPTGRVLATDINPRHMPEPTGFEVLRHDITTEPVPDGPWDLIHARLVLLHLPEREEVLRHLVAALAPGGALMLEEWDATYERMVLSAPDRDAARLLQSYQDLLVSQILPANGNDPTWAGRVHATMLAAGLTNVDTEVSCRSWAGGSAGALLIAANIGQLREKFIAAGMTADQLDRITDLVTDPRLVLRGHLTWSTVGRKPPP
jgi:SAM-dependent methyltransferase